jgi:hypothetical protein
LSALMYDIANNAPLDPRVARSELPQAVADILQRTLNKVPEARFPTGEALAIELRRVASGLPSGVDLVGAAQLSEAESPFEATLVQPQRSLEVESANNTGPLAI